jgi:hypothetical protein
MKLNMAGPSVTAKSTQVDDYREMRESMSASGVLSNFIFPCPAVFAFI